MMREVASSEGLAVLELSRMSSSFPVPVPGPFVLQYAKRTRSRLWVHCKLHGHCDSGITAFR